MEYKRIVVGTMDCLGVNKSYLGYDYVVYGMMLTLENKEYATYITKSLYLDIAKHFDTSWNCVEKNIRTVVNAAWHSENTELLEIIFKKSSRTKKPTNKEFFRYMYEYITDMPGTYLRREQWAGIICPISNRHCEELDLLLSRLFALSQSAIEEFRPTDKEDGKER